MTYRLVFAYAVVRRESEQNSSLQLLKAQQSRAQESGDLSRLRVRAELDEHDVGKIAIGGAVVIRAYAFRNREFAGKVATIAPTVRPGRISSPESGHLTDFSVNEVLIDLEDPGPLLVGMKVDAYFRPQK